MEGVATCAVALVLHPSAVVDVAVVVVHDALPLLVVFEPKTFVAVVVGEVIGSVTVLLVLEPLAFVFLAIGKLVDASTLPLALDVLTLVIVAIGIDGLTRSVWLASLVVLFCAAKVRQLFQSCK